MNIAGSVIAGVDQVADHQELGRRAARRFEFGDRGDLAQALAVRAQLVDALVARAVHLFMESGLVMIP